MVSPYAKCSRDDPADCRLCGRPLAGDNSKGVCTVCQRTRDWTCSVCGKELGERFHINGRDYCREHRPSPRPSVWDETVRGTIIGDMGDTHYQFWQDGRKIAETDATCDGAAIRWFQENYPDQYAQGVEMRAFDL
jgi:hypothetical protein